MKEILDVSVRSDGRSTKSRLALVTDGQNQDCIVLHFIAVKRDIAGSALRNNKFTQTGFSLSANQRVTGQNSDGFVDQVECFQSVHSSVDKKVADAFEVGERLPRIAYFCHGLASGLPAS